MSHTNGHLIYLIHRVNTQVLRAQRKKIIMGCFHSSNILFDFATFLLAGQSASVGLSRTVVDNQDLGWSAIARTKCVTPGERNPTWVDADLNYGVNYNYGFTMDSCTMISKQEMLARELLNCTFSPLVGDNMERCSSNQSVAYFRSFIDANQTATPDLPVFYIDNKPDLRRRYEKICPADCIQDR